MPRKKSQPKQPELDPFSAAVFERKAAARMADRELLAKHPEMARELTWRNACIKPEDLKGAVFLKRRRDGTYS
jgi:hypothetical protein